MAAAPRNAGNSNTEGRPALQTVVIIGAAEGIGRELARAHLRSAKRLVLVDNNQQLLEQTVIALRQSVGEADTAAEITSLVVDVRLEADIARVAAHLTGAAMPLRLYITAALSAVGPFAAVPREALLNVYRVNCLPIAHLFRHLLAHAPDDAWSAVLFSSLAVYTHYPGAVCYVGTKAFISALSFAIDQQRVAEARERKIAVVYPGPIATRHAARYSPDSSRESARLSAEVAAKQIVAQLQRGKTIIFLRPIDKIIAMVAVIAPRLFGALMRTVIYRKITDVLLPPKQG